MGIQGNLSDDLSTKGELDAYAISELHTAMLRLWDRLRLLAGVQDPSPIEVNYVIEEFSIAWHMITGQHVDNNDSGNKESLPESFGRMLFKRLRLQYLEFQKKHG